MLIIDVQTVEELIQQAKWKASTHAGGLHEYILRDQLPELYDQIVQLLKHRGYNRQWGKTTYTYVNIGDYRYWLYPPVLNRAFNKEEKQKTLNHY